jgi:CheY-like chemotaxis protein
VLLVVENDLTFARLLLETAHEIGFKVLVTSLGAAALTMTREYHPVAITLDICLPDIDGWRVLERLKNDLTTRHIPVCVMSTEEVVERALSAGAVRVVTKPIKTKDTLQQVLEGIRDFVGRPTRELLVAGSDPGKCEQLLKWSDGEEIRVTAVASGNEVLENLEQRRIDCVVLDPALPDMSLAALAGELQRRPALCGCPVLVYADDELPPEDEASLRELAKKVSLRQVRSPDRLLDQAAFFLHSPVAKLAPERRQMLEQLHQTDKVLAGKKVLIVDDDIRNIFALTSILEGYNMEIISSETGRGAIKILQEQPNVDIVLMDIMMPEMDGFETMREIRKNDRFKGLPIIAVTAKAMKGDREKCIEAGAWDYLSKPVDSEQMLSVLRSWLYR